MVTTAYEIPLAQEEDPCDERRKLEKSGDWTPRWEGPVNYKMGALIVSYGRFEGVLVANEPGARTARISGDIYGVGVQGGYITGQIDNAVWVGNSPGDFIGSNGAFLHGGIGLGAGPLNILDFSGEVAVHNEPNRAAVSSFQGRSSGPGLSTTFNPADPRSYFEKPKVGIGVGGGVGGFEVKNFEIISDPCAD